MASKYVTGYNPFQDFLLQSILFGVDLLDKKMFADIYSSFVYILQNILDNDEDIIHLDFEIKGNKDNIKFIGKNAITAIWLSGVFPEEIDEVLNNSKFIIGDRLYKFNKKTKTLTHVKIK